MRPKFICVKCSTNEKTNPTMEDVELVPLESEFFGDEDAEFETWQCIRCKYKLWVRVNLNNKGE